MPIIRVPDLVKTSVAPEAPGRSETEFEYQEYEVTVEQAERWTRLNDKEQLLIVLKADRENRDVREYL
ncbi:MAG: hypothetical protein ABSF83_12160 [Nitrososphaerales archaeon]|jgi:hypothetical protein